MAIEIFNEDCMIGMKRYADKYFDLAIVDPPYRDKNQPTDSMRDKINGRMKHFGAKPTAEYFKELFRISNNQLIWGANNFLEYLPSTNCFIFWYKQNPMDNYSDGELAWTSFDSVARCVPLKHFGAHTSDKDKIHPTQKPIKLYAWILDKYAKPNDKILDTHLGSGSIAIACHDSGHDLVGFEIDTDYYNAALKRLKTHQSQGKLFNPAA